MALGARGLERRLLSTNRVDVRAVLKKDADEVEVAPGGGEEEGRRALVVALRAAEPHLHAPAVRVEVHARVDENVPRLQEPEHDVRVAARRRHVERRAAEGQLMI